MKAVPLDPSEVGSFYNGDSYLVLDNRGEMGADIHMWIGESRAGATTCGRKSKVLRVKGEVAARFAPTLHVWGRSRSLGDASAVSVWPGANRCPPLTPLHARRREREAHNRPVTGDTRDTALTCSAIVRRERLHGGMMEGTEGFRSKGR